MVAFVKQTDTNMSDQNSVEWFGIVRTKQERDRVIIKFVAGLERKTTTPTRKGRKKDIDVEASLPLPYGWS